MFTRHNYRAVTASYHDATPIDTQGHVSALLKGPHQVTVCDFFIVAFVWNIAVVDRFV
jgi:hypothetical protein